MFEAFLRRLRQHNEGTPAKRDEAQLTRDWIDQMVETGKPFIGPEESDRDAFWKALNGHAKKPRPRMTEGGDLSEGKYKVGPGTIDAEEDPTVIISDKSKYYFIRITKLRALTQVKIQLQGKDENIHILPYPHFNTNGDLSSVGMLTINDSTWKKVSAIVWPTSTP